MASLIPENRARFTLGEIAEIASGTLYGAADLAVEGVVSDSRQNLAGKLFVALPGDRYDGHAFVSAALRAGARALLVERDVPDAKAPLIRVASTYTALGLLARAQRRRWGGRLVAVAGSAGKTTTKSCVAAALESLLPGRVHHVAGNLNNRVGVPFVLLSLVAEKLTAVVEIGTNAPGEVAELTRLAEPDVGVLTLIGLEHTEGLGSLDDIDVEESSLLLGLGARATAIGNADDERVQRALERSRVAARVGYGFSERAAYRILERSMNRSGTSRLRIGRPGRPALSLDCPLLGDAGAYAVAAAVAAAEAATTREIQAAELSQAVARWGSVEAGRLSPLPLADEIFVLDDTYNSNPASLASSVRAAAELSVARAGRLVLVLGEMRELGERSPEFHRQAAETLLGAGAGLVLGVVGDARWFLEPFTKRGVETAFCEDVEAAATLLMSRLLPGDVVLVKASRSVRAERIVERLRERGGSPT